VFEKCRYKYTPCDNLGKYKIKCYLVIISQKCSVAIIVVFVPIASVIFLTEFHLMNSTLPSLGDILRSVPPALSSYYTARPYLHLFAKDFHLNSEFMNKLMVFVSTLASKI
jgi:hypothetical protein